MSLSVSIRGVSEVSELRALASDVAREAGTLLLARLPGLRTKIETKSSITDLVTEVDRESEALVVRRILAARPDDGILGEEGAERTGTSGLRWLIDPLDGTTNYVYRRGDFCVSIGVEAAGGEVVAGAVYDPSREELFSAAKGVGAALNGRSIGVSGMMLLATALVGTGFGYDTGVRERQAAVLSRVMPHVRDIRRAGSAALDLCAVACGRLDAYYESGLQPWDMAAGSLIVREAGGVAKFVDIPGERRAIVAAGEGLWEGLAKLLRAGT
jgi:myo-inositol-1(or 4)-monophosphatase